MIEIEGLTKSFGSIAALSDVSFSVGKNQIVGFLGANGAGKTTTLDILCGCAGADSGQAKIAGFEISEQPNLAKEKLGYLPDEPPLYPDMKVIDYIEYAARIRKVPKQDIRAKTNQCLEKLDLGTVRNRLIGNLSKGFKQRVGLAQALIHDPEVLILDEPTEGLDPNQIIQIRKLIKELSKDHTILFSSHILSEVENLCDQVVVIDKGTIVGQGSYSQLIEQLEKGANYVLTVRTLDDTLLHKIEAIDSVSLVKRIESDENSITFHASEESDSLDEIAAIVAQNKSGLRELRKSTKSLEDIFFQLTKDRSFQS